MQAMLIETERTPNPATLKFLPGREVLGNGTREFTSPEDAEASPLASALFSLGDVTGVFYGRDFISVTKGEGSADWLELKPQVLGVLVDHFASGAPLFQGGGAAAIDVPADIPESDPEDADIIDQINDLIETRIRPAVARDGGDIVYRGYDKGVVYLQMQGACSGCPSSAATLKQGIETLLKHYVPEVIDVRAL
jgi:Fe-S cluster biogenesis protein NfuA